MNAFANTPDHEALPASNLYKNALLPLYSTEQLEVRYNYLHYIFFRMYLKADIHNHLTPAIE